MTYNNNTIETTITMTTYNNNINVSCQGTYATAVSPLAPAGGPPTQVQTDALDEARVPLCHAGVYMQCWSVARRPHAAPPRRATGPGCSPRIAGPGAFKL